MRSEPRGRRTLGVEVTNISRHGFWMLVGGKELFVRFKDFPWFKEVSVRHLLNVRLPQPHHLYWPDLDIDLAVESIEHPERFPLVSKVRPSNALRRAGGGNGRRWVLADSGSRRR